MVIHHGALRTPPAALLQYFQRRHAPKTVEPAWGEPLDRERDLSAIDRAYRCRADVRTDAAADRTWRDLSLGEVFCRVDRCLTSIGQEMLYRRLREPTAVPAEISDLQRSVAAFRENTVLRDKTAKALRPLAQNQAPSLAPLLYGRPPDDPAGSRIFPLVTVATIVATLASFVWPFAIFGVISCVVGSIAVRVHTHGMLTAHGAQLASLTSLVRAAENLLAIESLALRPELSVIRGALAEIQGARASMSWLAADLPRMNEIAAMLLTYLNVFLLVDVHAFVHSLRLFRRHAPSLVALYETVGGLDAARSVASFRTGTITVSPSFEAPGSAIAADGLTHPLVADAVPNDVLLRPCQGWLVTGSNMSGKSTFLRAVALGAWLAQTIGCVTARSYRAPPLRIRTLIQVEDDVLRGRSHFLAEAHAAKDMLLEDAGGVDRLCVIDELFRGTNTADRVAAGVAFLRSLAVARGGAFVVAATHDGELLALLSEHFTPHYFQEEITTSGMTFDFRLRQGGLAPRNAFAVLALVGFPRDVLEDMRRA